jgi:hypothetical protein
LAVVFLVGSQPAFADSACPATDFFTCAGIADALDPQAKGPKVFGTVTAYYKPVFPDGVDPKVPKKSNCWGQPDDLFFEEGCTSNEISNPIYVIRLEQAGKYGHYFVEMDPADPRLYTADSSDLNYGHWECLQALADWNNLETVPLCSMLSADIQFEIFQNVMRNDALPRFLGTSGPVDFTLKSLTNEVFEAGTRPYYLVFDFTVTLND